MTVSACDDLFLYVSLGTDSIVITGECKTFMTDYLACMKKARGVNEHECRNLAKSYLSCRMDR